MSKHTFNIGPLTVSFAEDDFCYNLLETMYGDLPESSSDADIQIRGHNWRETKVPSKCVIRASDQISVDGEMYYINEIHSISPPQKWVTDRIGQRGYALVIDGVDSETLSLDVYYDGRLYEDTARPLRCYLRFSDRTFANYRDKLAKDFVYEIFEPVWQARMLKKGVTFLHSGSVSIDGSAIALTGWGGAGKTSATTALVRKSDNIQFLSDDLAIVTSQGELYPYYKSSVIYPYNTEDGALLESDFLNGSIDQLQWKVGKYKNGKKGVRRRIPPKKLFSGQVGSPGSRSLEKVVYLSREKRNELDHEYMTTEELARRSTAVILDELNWLVEYSSTVRAAGSKCTDPYDIVQRTEKVYQDTFSDVENILLHIPMSARPTELASYIKSSIW